jgi:hypothetical protein
MIIIDNPQNLLKSFLIDRRLTSVPFIDQFLIKVRDNELYVERQQIQKKGHLEKKKISRRKQGT